MKATLLMVLTNFGVIIVLSLFMRLVGLDQVLAREGIASAGFLLMACVYGFFGSFISLMMSKGLAKRQMRVQIIENPGNKTEQWLLMTVRRQAEKVGVGMPEVGIFDHPTPNAFATGANKNAALVAVSTGLLHAMNREEVEAVLGHEMSHVANGDMVTSALIQGTINSFVIVFARIIATLLTRNQKDRGNFGAYFATYIVLQIVLGFLGSIVVMWHSRHREFAADRGGAELAGRQKMIAALQRLQMAQEHSNESAITNEFRAFGIVAMNGLFASHPPLTRRIAALEALATII